MRFIVDECSGPLVAEHLKKEGHIVFSVYEEARGIDDEKVLRLAFEGDYILITNDKDFGDLIFRLKMKHKGVILLRLEDERATNKIKILDGVLKKYSNNIKANFCVVTEKTVRVIEP